MRMFSDGTMKIEVKAVQFHRNGVGGEGFHVVAFRWAHDGNPPRDMVGIVFRCDEDEPKTENCQVAVLDAALAAQGRIGMFEGNAWRGDHFERVLCQAIHAYEAARAAEFQAPATKQK